jgi:steroid 5-alpha reductase family enzyme
MLSLRLRDASIVDVFWGLGFALLAWFYCLLSPEPTVRAWLVVGLITAWGVRLALHIHRRNHGKGEDARYQAMRASHGFAFEVVGDFQSSRFKADPGNRGRVLDTGLWRYTRGLHCAHPCVFPVVPAGAGVSRAVTVRRDIRRRPMGITRKNPGREAPLQDATACVRCR